MSNIIVIVWTTTWASIIIMVARLLLRKIKKQKFDSGDYLTMVAIFCAILRLASDHVVLIWGTNNLTKAFRAHHNFTPAEIYKREVGSKMILVTRFFYTSYLWLQKCVLLVFYQRLMRNVKHERVILNVYWTIFFICYVVVQIVTFTECNPFNHYWVVVPNPGDCSKAEVQLFTLGGLNIFTDLMLIVLPIHVLSKFKRPMKQKLELALLFSVGLFVITVTALRLQQNYSHGDAQTNRTTWASAEELAAAFVANAPAMYVVWHQHRENNSTGQSSGGYASYGNQSGRYGKGSTWKSTTQSSYNDPSDKIEATTTIHVGTSRVKDSGLDKGYGKLADEDSTHSQSMLMRNNTVVITGPDRLGGRGKVNDSVV